MKKKIDWQHIFLKNAEIIYKGCKIKMYYSSTIGILLSTLIYNDKNDIVSKYN